MEKNGLRVRLGGAVYLTALTVAVGVLAGGLGETSAQVAGSEPDPELGRRLFTDKGCISCHTIGAGRLVGPDLQKVTERRSASWTVAMITSPDSMLRADATARALLQSYVTRMPDLDVRPYEATALVAYFQTRAEGIAASDSAPTGRPAGQASGHHGGHHGKRHGGMARGERSHDAGQSHHRARHHGAQSTPN